MISSTFRSLCPACPLLSSLFCGLCDSSRRSVVVAVVVVIAIIAVAVVAVAGPRDRGLAKGPSTWTVCKRQPRLGLALTHSPLRVITDARGKRALQTRPLCVGEAHLVVQPAEWLELAFENVVGDRSARDQASHAGVGELRLADGAGCPCVLHAVDDAGVVRRRRLVARHLLFVRLVAPVGFDGGEPLVHEVESS